MAHFLSRVRYFPILKWKQGEYRAVGTVNSRTKSRICPIFVVPPSGDYDHETGRKLEPFEHLKSFGSRLYANWGSRFAFVDAQHVDDDLHNQAGDAHSLTVLLERARQAGAFVGPATSLRRSTAYQNAVARFMQRHPLAAVCVRLGLEDLDSRTLSAEIDQLLATLKCSAERVVLIVDLAATDLTETEALAELLIDRLNNFPKLLDFVSLAVACTSFPERPRVSAGQVRAFPRHDWALYESVIAKRDRLTRTPAYGDYGIEYPSYSTTTRRITPVAQLRYSLEKSYLISKGKKVRKPEGNAVIVPVAKELVGRPEFIGPSFSEGDRLIHAIANGSPFLGNASTWRQAGTDHHLTMVDFGTGDLLGVHDERPQEVAAEQTSLELVPQAGSL